ncbi:WD40-repeat protein [Thalassiosira pseudonana CCMP1335]|uniref:WD40-repeat protein n=1 Tax=Thalassiosira pseudonana TaxID=35128 RepID=B8C5B0_THAPS|nr:WD40-repeat protein [Thalassiosira pseudonana CCMP1335]EED91086.1 WD40-repeat protein [Thalassiosira pseudonana CCMP1335]
MSSFQPTAHLHAHNNPTASTTRKVHSTTHALSTSLESHPTHGKWWIRNYGIGPRRDVRYLTRKSSLGNRYGRVEFRTSSGLMPIGSLNFGPGASGASAAGGALIVASGPRVSLYGGTKAGATSDFNRALKAGSSAQKRRQEREDDEENEVDLFGGKTTRQQHDNDSNNNRLLDAINADRHLSTGGHMASCAAHRSDGRLIAVGTEGGALKICDAYSRATLRSFGSTKQGGGGDRKSVRSVVWMRDGKRVVAGGDDGVVRVWNVSGGGADGSGADLSLVGHGDSVRAVAVTSSWSQVVVSGSYDHTIRVWEVGTNAEGVGAGDDRCLSVMNHGDPVQALLVLPPIDSYGLQKKQQTKYDNIPLLVSAGGTTLKIWNPLTGSCLGKYQTKHAKTITAMCLLDIPKRQIITGGLDGLLRIHSISNQDIMLGSLPFLHGMQITDPISALALSQDMSRLAIGTTTGLVMVHQRRRTALAAAIQREAAAAAAVGKKREPRHGTYSYFMRGAHEKSHDPDDYLLMQQKKQKLAEYDVLLKKFRYSDALDKVLESRQPQVVIAVIEELGKRRGLTIALSNRDEESLESILSFTIRFIDNPQYTPYLIGVAHILCDIYGSLMGQSSVVDELISKLRAKVSSECSVQKMLLRLLGQIDYVQTTAEMQGVEER